MVVSRHLVLPPACHWRWKWSLSVRVANQPFRSTSTSVLQLFWAVWYHGQWADQALENPAIRANFTSVILNCSFFFPWAGKSGTLETPSLGFCLAKVAYDDVCDISYHCVICHCYSVACSNLCESWTAIHKIVFPVLLVYPHPDCAVQLGCIEVLCLTGTQASRIMLGLVASLIAFFKETWFWILWQWINHLLLFWKLQLSGFLLWITFSWSVCPFVLTVSVDLSEETLEEFNRRFVVIYTGRTRLARNILQVMVCLCLLAVAFRMACTHCSFKS